MSYVQEAAALKEQQQALPLSASFDAACCAERVESAHSPFVTQSHALPPVPFHPSHAAHNSATTEQLKPLEMTKLQAECIADSMTELKERAAKRQKLRGINHSLALNAAYELEESLSCHDGNGFDILEELDAQPHIVQVVATSGGLITHWNEAFTKITKPSASLQKIPLTIFELVDSKSLSLLYNMLALALHNINISGVEEFTLDESGRSSNAGETTTDGNKSTISSSSHLSITLPCRQLSHDLPHLSTGYNITVVFMNATVSTKSCFLGIFTPRASDDDCSLSSGSIATEDSAVNGDDNQDVNESNVSCHLPIGKILRVKDELLCQMLLEANKS